jgi:mannose-1-phosphate guanylyltransferase
MDLVVAIMAGGAGTRFWPASLRAKPKQFLRLVGDRTLLQQSFARACALTSLDRILVVTNTAFTALVREQLPELAADHIIGEPERKDTAAAAVLATLLAEKLSPGCVVAILTSDHVIGPVDAFAACIKSAADEARAHDALVTIGIRPTFASTGFGYLEIDGPRVARFVEKPNVEKAHEYVASGRYLWNSGMFVWKTTAALDEMKQHLSQHVDALSGAVNGTAAPRDAFAKLSKISIDYGLMEKAAHVRCVPSTFSWADVGSFPALADHLPNGTNARLVSLDAKDNVVWSEDSSELVALVGVEDLIVVRAGKRTLVAKKERAEDIKKLVDKLPLEDT